MTMTTTRCDDRRKVANCAVSRMWDYIPDESTFVLEIREFLLRYNTV